jgi:hypothetical protein
VVDKDADGLKLSLLTLSIVILVQQPEYRVV